MDKPQDDAGAGDRDPKPGTSDGGKPAEPDFRSLFAKYLEEINQRNKRKLVELKEEAAPSATVTSGTKVRILFNCLLKLRLIMIFSALVLARAGTGSNISGFGPRRAFDFRLRSVSD